MIYFGMACFVNSRSSKLTRESWKLSRWLDYWASRVATTVDLPCEGQKSQLEVCMGILPARREILDSRCASSDMLVRCLLELLTL